MSENEQCPLERMLDAACCAVGSIYQHHGQPVLDNQFLKIGAEKSKDGAKHQCL